MISALVSKASGPGSSLGQDTQLSPGTQGYKWVPENCWGNLKICGEVTCDGLASRPGGVEILLAASCYKTGKSSGSYEPDGSKS